MDYIYVEGNHHHPYDIHLFKNTFGSWNCFFRFFEYVKQSSLSCLFTSKRSPPMGILKKPKNIRSLFLLLFRKLCVSKVKKQEKDQSLPHIFKAKKVFSIIHKLWGERDEFRYFYSMDLLFLYGTLSGFLMICLLKRKFSTFKFVILLYNVMGF